MVTNDQKLEKITNTSEQIQNIKRLISLKVQVAILITAKYQQWRTENARGWSSGCLLDCQFTGTKAISCTILVILLLNFSNFSVKYFGLLLFCRSSICSHMFNISSNVCCCLGTYPIPSPCEDRTHHLQRVPYFRRGSRRSKRGSSRALSDMVPATRANDRHGYRHIGFLSRLSV